MKTAVIYDLVSKKVNGIIGLSLDSDLPLNVKTEEGHIEIFSDHPIYKEQDCWEVRENQGKDELVRKPQAIIDSEKTSEEAQNNKRQKENTLRLEIPFEFLISQINELKQKLNLPPLTSAQAKTEIENMIQIKLLEGKL